MPKKWDVVAVGEMMADFLIQYTDRSIFDVDSMPVDDIKFMPVYAGRGTEDISCRSNLLLLFCLPSF